MADYEPATIACCLAALDELGPGDFFDVGANVGVFSFVAAVLTDRAVVAFEPTPDLAAAARSIARENGLSYVVEELALGAADGTAVLHLSDTTDSSNSLRRGFRPSAGSIPVRVETLDGYCARTSRAPAVLKVDTESTEPDVLRGAAEVLREQRPWVICEVLANRTEIELMEVLRPLNYRWYRISSDPPFEAAAEIIGDRTYQDLNWLFAPEVPQASFWNRMADWLQELEDCRTA